MLDVSLQTGTMTGPRRDTSAFKAYDIRGVVGENIDANFVECVARVATEILGATSAAVGFDARETSSDYAQAAARGCMNAGASVLGLGLCGTEEVYHAVGSNGLGLGIMVTASHNPIDHNGLKLVGPNARPLTENEFAAIRERAASISVGAGKSSPPANLDGKAVQPELDLRQAYVQSAIDVAGITSEATLRRTTRILFNCGNGAAGPTLKAILSNLGVRGVQIDAHFVHGLPDPTFQNGIPNPLIPKNHAATASEVVRLGADFGVAFDGDFDRCFFFDGAGTFVGGEYLVALLAEANLRREAGCTIVHDPRLVYAARDKIRAAGGVAIQSGTGHALVKAKMREVGAAYGGEMSAHHYFRDFFYCDSGMIPWMAIIALLAAEEKTLSECVAALRAAYPSSGEINFQIENKWDALARLRAAYVPHAAEVDEGDGLSCDMGAWRFNVRASNTEDLLRLNVEARGQAVSLDGCVAQLSKIIEGTKA